MARRGDGTEVPHAEALREWASVAYEVLKSLAHTYNKVVSYTELSAMVQDETDLTTDMLLPNWIGKVLEIAAQRAADAKEPPLTALCVRADGTIGPGYERAPKFAPASTATDVEQLAAEHRLRCYQEFADDLPANGGSPTLTPQVELRRRKFAAPNGNERWLDDVITRGSLSTRDNVPFHSHVEVARLFGRSYKGHQTATFRLDDVTEVWFPKMYPNGDWDNSLSSDEQVITMRHVPGGSYGDIMTNDPDRVYAITFGHVQPESGPRYYRFLGVFAVAAQLCDATKWVHQLVSNTITFDGGGVFGFSPLSTRPEHDDQGAEAADPDPKLVAEFREQIDAGSYAVADRIGTTKTRGSAQAAFAKRVKDNYGWECAVTGIQTPAFLVASHIIPWSEDKTSRLDPTNGICLSTFVDRAFDAGLLAITADLRTSIRWDRVGDDPILKVELAKIDDVELARPSSSPPDPAKVAKRLDLGY